MPGQQTPYFTEAELFQALHWGMPEAAARSHAQLLAAENPAVQATIPEYRDFGPMTANYSEDLLLLLSLVSEETNRKVEARLLDVHQGRPMSREERANWESRRAEFRLQLIRAGKLPDNG